MEFHTYQISSVLSIPCRSYREHHTLQYRREWLNTELEITVIELTYSTRNQKFVFNTRHSCMCTKVMNFTIYSYNVDEMLKWKCYVYK